MSPPEPPRTVFGRAVAVLAAFTGAAGRDLSLTELAHRTALPLTTVHRLCGQLVREGILERASGGGYRVGLRLWELGMLAPRAHGLREAALPFLEDLYEVTHQNVQLVVLEGTETVVVERLRARDSVRLVSRAGGRLPVHATSGGIALLAHAHAETLGRVLARPMPRFTEATIGSEHELRTAVSSVRRQGWIELREHITPGSVSIAAPVLMRDGLAVAAVSLVGSATEDMRALIPAVLTTARGIARALGRDEQPIGAARRA